MPTYRFRCPAHGDHDEWQSIHDSSTVMCETCAEPLLRVMTPPRISVYATPHKGQTAKEVDARENRWHRDMPAYKALRHQGYQPSRIDGSDALSRDANDRMEIEMGHRIPKDQLSQAKEVNQQLAESAREGSFATEYGKTLPRKAS